MTKEIKSSTVNRTAREENPVSRRTYQEDVPPDKELIDDFEHDLHGKPPSVERAAYKANNKSSQR